MTARDEVQSGDERGDFARLREDAYLAWRFWRESDLPSAESLPEHAKATLTGVRGGRVVRLTYEDLYEQHWGHPIGVPFGEPT